MEIIDDLLPSSINIEDIDPKKIGEYKGINVYEEQDVPQGEIYLIWK